MIRRAILSVAVGGWYPDGQQRLFDSIEERGENATRLFWRDEYPPGCREHTQAPYAFKPYAFKQARELGFHHALWMDASCWAIRTLDTIWGRLAEDGYYLEPDGNMVGNWISDGALHELGLGRDEALEIPLFEGKLIGLDLTDDLANAFLDEWLRLADTGAFWGPWTNTNGDVSPDPRCHGHRHDIALGSPVAHSFAMHMQPVKAVGFPSNGEPGEEILVMAQGM